MAEIFTLYNILGFILIVVCLVLNVVILKQKKRTAGLSGTMAGMGETQTYWDKNKGRSSEGRLEFWSKILGGIFMALALLLNVIK